MENSALEAPAHRLLVVHRKHQLRPAGRRRRATRLQFHAAVGIHSRDPDGFAYRGLDKSMQPLALKSSLRELLLLLLEPVVPDPSAVSATRRERPRPLEPSENTPGLPSRRPPALDSPSRRFEVLVIYTNFHIIHKKAARATAIETGTASSATVRGTGPFATRATGPAAATAARENRAAARAARGKNSRVAGGRRRRTTAARGARAAARARAGAPRRRRR